VTETKAVKIVPQGAVPDRGITSLVQPYTMTIATYNLKSSSRFQTVLIVDRMDRCSPCHHVANELVVGWLRRTRGSMTSVARWFLSDSGP